MDKLVTAVIIAIAFGAFAAPVMAMTDFEYESQRRTVREEYSHKFVDCLKFSGREKSRCESDIRDSRSVALKALEKDYKSSRESNSVRP